MKLWRRRDPAGTSQPKHNYRAVQVKFLDNMTTIRRNGGADSHGYSYSWSLIEVPRVGQIVVVEGLNGLTLAQISALGRGPEARNLRLKPVLRIATDSEVQRFGGSAIRAQSQWFDQARRQAGLPPIGRVLHEPLGDYPAIPPVDAQTYTREQANLCGRVWWRIYKEAQDAGLPAAETKRFEEIARAWFHRRDQHRGSPSPGRG